MKAKNLNNISDNSLSELRSLFNRIESLIERDYCHVSEYINESTLKAIQSQINHIEKQVDKRQDEL